MLKIYSERSKCRTGNRELEWWICTSLTAGCDKRFGHVQACVCVFVHQSDSRFEKWIIIFSALWHIHKLCICGAFLRGLGMTMIIIKSTGKYIVLCTRTCKETMKGKFSAHNPEGEFINQLLRFPKSIPCDDSLAALCIHVYPRHKKSKSLPQYIFLSPFLFTEAVYLWQKQQQVTGATRINRLLPSTANKCERLPSHIQTLRSGCVHPEH